MSSSVGGVTGSQVLSLPIGTKIRKLMCFLCYRPFSGCVCFTLFTNVIPMVAMIYFMATNWSNSCSKPLQTWLLVQVGLFFVNGLFGYYVFQKVSSNLH